MDLTGIDDDEIDSYIMTEREIKCKTDLWMRVNAEYLREKAEKEERERKEEEEAIREGRELKRKRKPPPPGGKDGKKQKVNLGGNQTAMEAIEKMVQVSQSVSQWRFGSGNVADSRSNSVLPLCTKVKTRLREYTLTAMMRDHTTFFHFF